MTLTPVAAGMIGYCPGCEGMLAELEKISVKVSPSRPPMTDPVKVGFGVP